MSNREVIPIVPESWGCEVVGYLYDSDDPVDLSQDMLEVMTPSGILITAGWEPDGKPDGAYIVRASFGFKELGCVPSTDIDQAASDVQQFVRQFLDGRDSKPSTFVVWSDAENERDDQREPRSPVVA